METTIIVQVTQQEMLRHAARTGTVPAHAIRGRTISAGRRARPTSIAAGVLGGRAAVRGHRSLMARRDRTSPELKVVAEAEAGREGGA
jgi:hypothetical protein